jgi:hypothetical protein
MPGQLRLRVRYRDLIGPWFDYLIVSPDEMAAILEGTGWRIHRLLQQDGSGYYVAVLSRREGSDPRKEGARSSRRALA